jgi:hypothetical protein
MQSVYLVVALPVPSCPPWTVEAEVPASVFRFSSRYSAIFLQLLLGLVDRQAIVVRLDI